MNRKLLFIALLMAVFAFSANDSFVFAKSCKDQKSDLRAEKKAVIRSLCEGKILPQLDKLTKHTSMNTGRELALLLAGDEKETSSAPPKL